MADEKKPPQETPDMPRPEDRTIIKPMDEGGEESTPARPKHEPPYLVVVEGPRMGARFPLGEGPCIIGRTSGNAVRLEDQSVSRQHAEVSRGASGWTVRDLGSKNGTLVNGKPIAETVVIGHKDVIKTGIYQLRLITEPTKLEEEMTLPPELLEDGRTVFVAAPPDSLTEEVRKRDIPHEGEPLPHLPPGGPDRTVADVPLEPPKHRFGRRQIVLIGVLAIVAIATAAFFGNRILFNPSKPKKPVRAMPARTEPQPAPEVQPQVEPAPQPVSPEGQPAAGEAAPAPAAPTAVAPTAQAAGAAAATAVTVPSVPLFLDFASSPMPAKVTFQDKEVGITPVKANVELEPGKTYAVQAQFVMPEIQQQYTQQVEFTVEKDKPIIPILFKGPIGTLKVSDLPRDVQFYLEGKFEYDRFQEQPAKLQQIVLQKPIYIPFGKYSIELKRSKQLGETSQSYVADIIFRREFTLASESPAFELSVKEEDLTFFPAKIKSDPPNADVFVDGKPVGKTPFEGNLPLGSHKLTVSKEGYFDHNEELKMDINMPYLADVKLKTSVAGQHINNARQAMIRGMYQDAINELAQSLSSQPAPTEVALTNYMLGKCYLQLGDIQRAMGYFEQARASDTQRYPATLGLVSGYAMMQNMNEALPLLVEVLLNAKDDETRREAHDLFQKISPFRSVIYIYTTPPGATVLVNDKPVAQPTPVILHELALGNYRIRLEKQGYQPTDLSISLSVNEFNPVIVELKPVPQ